MSSPLNFHLEQYDGPLDLLLDLRVREVTADDLGRFGNCDRLLANVNTPAEYASLEALQGHKK